MHELQRHQPTGASPKIRDGYAMLEQPEGFSQTFMQVSGSAQPTVSGKQIFLLMSSLIYNCIRKINAINFRTFW